MYRQAAWDVRDTTRVAAFAALIAVLGLPGAVPVFGGAVPITLQTLGVMLAGTILGPWRGAAAVITFEALVLIGLPIVSGGRGGAGMFVGPSAGYLLGWIFGVVVVGAIASVGSGRPRWWRTAVACVTGGILVVYAFGIPIQALVTRLPLAETALTSTVFLPGDIVKAALATIITRTLWRAYPRAFTLRIAPKHPAKTDVSA